MFYYPPLRLQMQKSENLNKLNDGTDEHLSDAKQGTIYCFRLFLLPDRIFDKNLYVDKDTRTWDDQDAWYDNYCIHKSASKIDPSVVVTVCSTYLSTFLSFCIYHSTPF